MTRCPSARAPLFYRAILGLATPVVRRWGRLEVSGCELLMQPGALLVVGNHDSYWDPVVVGVAALGHRHIRAVAKADLWRNRAMGWVLDRMGQLRVTRGRADLRELDAIAGVLGDGGSVGIFPEGRISLGRTRRAYSGAGWLARTTDARVVSVAITGAIDIARFPRRPRIRVRFFEPVGGQLRPGESSIGFSRRVTAEIRAQAPAVASGRRTELPSEPRLPRTSAEVMPTSEAATRSPVAA